MGCAVPAAESSSVGTAGALEGQRVEVGSSLGPSVDRTMLGDKAVVSIAVCPRK